MQAISSRSIRLVLTQVTESVPLTLKNHHSNDTKCLERIVQVFDTRSIYFSLRSHTLEDLLSNAMRTSHRSSTVPQYRAQHIRNKSSQIILYLQITTI